MDQLSSRFLGASLGSCEREGPNSLALPLQQQRAFTEYLSEPRHHTRASGAMSPVLTATPQGQVGLVLPSWNLVPGKTNNLHEANEKQRWDWSHSNAWNLPTHPLNLSVKVLEGMFTIPVILPFSCFQLSVPSQLQHHRHPPVGCFSFFESRYH